MQTAAMLCDTAGSLIALDQTRLTMNCSGDLYPLLDAHPIPQIVKDMVKQHHKGQEGDAKCIKPAETTLY